MADSNNPETPKAKPTEKQMNFLAILMQNTRGKPDIDWEAVVAQSGLKNEKVAKTTYSQMVRKFGWNTASASSTGQGGQSSSHTKAGSSASVAGGPDTPTKVRKRTGKVGTKRPATKKNNPEEDDEEEDVYQQGKDKRVVKNEEEDVDRDDDEGV